MSRFNSFSCRKRKAAHHSIVLDEVKYKFGDLDAIGGRLRCVPLALLDELAFEIGEVLSMRRKIMRGSGRGTGILTSEA
jgi:hypothetical protein